MLLTAQIDQLIGQQIADELAEVEARFAAELVSELDCVNQLVTHLEHYRGKMLRPMLVLSTGMAIGASGQAAGPVDEGHRVVSTVVEMVHMATLVHDDILDDAEIRRRGATVNSLNGNETAVMLGDYLISHAYHLCSSLGQPWIAQHIAATTNTVCEGELLQLANRNNWQLDEQTYFEIIRRKTASLCGACCSIAARLSGASNQMVDQLESYGELLGIAFQIVDDVLDLIGDPKKVGKTLGRDLEKGKLTLPLIHYLETADGEARTYLLSLLDSISDRNQPKASGELEKIGAEVRELLVNGQAVSYAQQRAQALVDTAVDSLADLPESCIKQTMQNMAAAVISRQS